ncbi:MAG TPA: type II toxin-antitoxin system HicA family toxin [Candidatus Dormibacteraeota bacterium]|nr:type II toxin-antitoxin system HicA family toxin [Candidatus Dormibacteraeota bacterium]
MRDALRLLRAAGWREVRRRGSHRQLAHRNRPGLVTVPGRLRDILAPGTWRTWNSLQKQAGWKP